MTDIEIMLLMVMLMTIPAHAGRTPRTSDVVKEKKNQSSPPTINPIGIAPDTQASKRCFRNKRTKQAAIKLAIGPKIYVGSAKEIVPVSYEAA